MSFIGEKGVDMGGFIKEFFYSVILCFFKVDLVFNVYLFGGLFGYLILLYGVDVILFGCFKMIGKLFVYSILYGGFGIFGFVLG